MTPRNLLTGVPNSFGADKVFVMGVQEGSVDLAIVRDGVEEPSAWFGAGDTIRLDGREWIVVELITPQGDVDTLMPGARTGRAVARIEMA